MGAGLLTKVVVVLVGSVDVFISFDGHGPFLARLCFW